MPSLAQLGFVEVVGTEQEDRVLGRDGAVVFGRQRDDNLIGTQDVGRDDDQLFFGGSGDDTYVFKPGNGMIIGDRFGSAQDSVRIDSAAFGSSDLGYLEISNKDLVIVDLATESGVWILDWLNPERAIEHFDFADGRHTLGGGFSPALVRQQHGYLGNASLAEVLRSEADEFRAVTRQGFARANELERTPQPEQVQITGTFGSDGLIGDLGPEIIRGLAGDDQISAGGGNDRVLASGGNDVISGGRGADDLHGGRSGDRIAGDAGDDRITGDAGDDRLIGNGGADALFGGSGADRLTGHRGNDVLSGGRGSDLLEGNGGADRLFGRGDDDIIHGGKGGDLLEGGMGADVMIGNAGADTLAGGGGADRFVISDLDGNVDVVLDFALAEGDRLDLRPVLPGFAAGDSVEAYVQLRPTAEGTVVAVDPAGLGGPFEDVARLEAVDIGELTAADLGLPSPMSPVLYFSADNGVTGQELFRFDPEAGEARVAADLAPGRKTSFPYELTTLDGELYFSATADIQLQLYRHDPDTLETTLAADLSPHNPTRFNGDLYFSASGSPDWGFYSYDPGTGEAHRIVEDSGGAAGTGYGFTPFDGKLYFGATGAATGRELFRYDPETDEVVPVADIEEGPAESIPGGFIAFDGDLWFSARTYWTGSELYRDDPEKDEVSLFADVRQGPASSGPGDFEVLDGQLYFRAGTDAVGSELFRYDPRTGEVSVAADISPGPEPSQPYDLTALDGALYLSAIRPGIGRELFRFDPVTGEATLVADIAPGPAHSGPGDFATLDGRLYFAATSPEYGGELYSYAGRELYSYDPETDELSLAADINEGIGSSNPFDLTSVGGDTELDDDVESMDPASMMAAIDPVISLDNLVIDSAVAA